MLTRKQSIDCLCVSIASYRHCTKWDRRGGLT